MPLLKAISDVGNIDDWKDANRFVAQALAEVQSVSNGQLEFGVNLKTVLLEVNFTAANADLRIEHGLGKTPTGYILVKSNTGTSLYDGSIPATESVIYLKSTAIAQVKILIF